MQLLCVLKRVNIVNRLRPKLASHFILIREWNVISEKYRLLVFFPCLFSEYYFRFFFSVVSHDNFGCIFVGHDSGVLVFAGTIEFAWKMFAMLFGIVDFNICPHRLYIPAHRPTGYKVLHYFVRALFCAAFNFHLDKCFGKLVHYYHFWMQILSLIYLFILLEFRFVVKFSVISFSSMWIIM